MASPLRRVAAPAVFLAAVLAGCTSHVHYPLTARTVPVSSTPVVDAFDYRTSLGDLRLSETKRRRRGYSARRFSMPASFENGQAGNLITGTYHAADTAGRKPLVIILPVWGVSEYPSKKMTRSILERSRGRMNVLRVDGNDRLMPWKRIEQSKTRQEFVAGVANAAHRLRHAVIDTRRLIDWARTRSEINHERIALVGFSISAVTGTLAVQSDSRIRSAALVMGGARIGRIVSECPGNEEDTRLEIIRNLGLDVAEYERTITAQFTGLDPTDYPGRVDPRRLLIVDARRDDCIPQESRDAWWEALGRPERISLNYSHRMSFLSMTPLGFNFLTRRIYHHLVDTL